MRQVVNLLYTLYQYCSSNGTGMNTEYQQQTASSSISVAARYILGNQYRMRGKNDIQYILLLTRYISYLVQYTVVLVLATYLLPTVAHTATNSRYIQCTAVHNCTSTSYLGTTYSSTYCQVLSRCVGKVLQYIIVLASTSYLGSTYSSTYYN